MNPQRIVPGPFFVCVKRDAGDAQAVASWKKSFVRSSTGEEDATSTTVAASAAGGGARHDGAATAYGRGEWRAATARPRAAAETCAFGLAGENAVANRSAPRPRRPFLIRGCPAGSGPPEARGRSKAQKGHRKQTRDLVGDAVGPLVRAQRLLGIDSE